MTFCNDDMKLHEIPIHYEPNRRKQSALTTTLMMHMFGCDHTMEKYRCNGNPSIFICKARVRLYNEGNIFCQMMCLVNTVEYLKELQLAIAGSWHIMAPDRQKRDPHITNRNDFIMQNHFVN
jgi:hypothetical protein